jgi:lysophospholipase L1-like esterase
VQNIFSSPRFLTRLFTLTLIVFMGSATAFGQDQEEALHSAKDHADKILKGWKSATPVTDQNVKDLAGEWIEVERLQLDPFYLQDEVGSRSFLHIQVGNIVVPAHQRVIEYEAGSTGDRKTKTVMIPEQTFPGRVLSDSSYEDHRSYFWAINHKSLVFTETDVFNYARYCRFSETDRRLYCRLKSDVQDDHYEAYLRTADFIPPAVTAAIPVPSPTEIYPAVEHGDPLRKISSPTQSVPVSDENIFLTPENWTNSKDGSIETNSPGAYLKLGFTGTSFAVVVDTSSEIKLPGAIVNPPAQKPDPKKPKPAPRMTDEDAISEFKGGGFGEDLPSFMAGPAPTPAGRNYELPKIGYRIDNGPINWQIVPVAAHSVTLQLAANLPAGDHEIKISLEGLGQDNRWNNPTDHLKILEFKIDEDAKTLAPKLRPKRVVVFGDSITEGANVYDNLDVVENKQWSETWDARLAQRLDAEISVIAYQAQGYEQGGGGDVPNFKHSYAYVRDGVKRKFSNPDYVFVLHGANGDTSQDDVSTMMTKLRVAYPKAKIFFGVPFGQRSQWAIEEGFIDCWQKDANLHFFDLGEQGARVADADSFDTIHPNPTGHTKLAELVYRQIYRFLADKPTPAPTTQK